MISKLKIFVSSLIALSLFGCIADVEIPKTVMTKAQMSEAMEALLIAEDITRLKGFQTDSSVKVFLGHYKPYELEKLGFTIAQFDSSYNFYVQHPQFLEEIMDSTESSLKRKVVALEKEKGIDASR